ncbi:MAG: hypothetical protein B7Z78_04465 [Rhodospirillales bacterium 20-60-12]|nr:MAG: hypothetical protein B7Z78_04465 [Rhodospirillales bacterium 20-60-12]HQT67802.1 hypothetical protein [Acetobacteraceae bacterium]
MRSLSVFETDNDNIASKSQMPDGAWLKFVDHRFIKSAYPDNFGYIESYHDAVAAVRYYAGLTIIQISEHLAFEGTYYSDAHPEVEDLPPLEQYKYWMTEGLGLGHSGNAAHHLFSIGLSLSAYPPSFAWKFYARSRPWVGGSRWTSLADFMQTGAIDLHKMISDDAESVSFLCAIGKHFSLRDDRQAVRAYELARMRSPLPAKDQQHLADAYLRLQLWRPALDLYRHIITSGHETAWTVRNALTCAGHLGSASAMVDDITNSAKRVLTDPLWPATLRQALALWYEEGEISARKKLSEGQFAAAESDISTLINHFAVSLGALAAPTHLLDHSEQPNTSRYVLILANTDDVSGYQGRVQSKLDIFDQLGVSYIVVSFNETQKFIELLPSARACILFRVPALLDIIYGLVLARQLGKPLYYDINEDISGPACLMKFEAYHGYLTSYEYQDLHFGHALYRAAARLCDQCLAPTAQLAQSLSMLCQSRVSHVVGEIDMLGLPVLEPSEQPSTHPVRIGLIVERFMYVDVVPGSPGHALFEVLKLRPDISLSILGPVKLGEAFACFRPRIFRTDGPTEAIPADIILWLTDQTADDEYHALRLWQLASRQALACVMWLRPDTLPELEHGHTIARASSALGWRDATLGLIDFPSKRQEIGLAARRLIEWQIEAQHARRALTQTLELDMNA